MNELVDLDLRIDRDHAAAERAEEDARKIIARLRLIPGAQQIVSRKRSYGQPPNPWRDGEINLSAQAAITRSDTALAHFLAKEAGKALQAADDNAIEQERLQAAAAAKLEAATAELRERRLARQAQHNASTFGRWSSFNGRVI